MVCYIGDVCHSAILEVNLRLSLGRHILSAVGEAVRVGGGGEGGEGEGVLRL